MTRDREPLDAAVDNVLAWSLGEACNEAASPSRNVGDCIDRGLILLRILNEKGFDVIVRREVIDATKRAADVREQTEQ